MVTLNEKTSEKCETIKSSGYKHVSIYNCQLKNNKDFQKLVKNYNKQIVDPLNPRDAMLFMVAKQTQPNFLYNKKKKRMWTIR